MLAVKFESGIAARRSWRHQGAHAAGRLVEEPKAVAADMRHVRIDGGARRCHRHHGFEGVAAFGKDGAAGVGCRMMGRGGDAAAMSGSVAVHGNRAYPIMPARRLVNPRLLSSAS